MEVETFVLLAVYNNIRVLFLQPARRHLGTDSLSHRYLERGVSIYVCLILLLIVITVSYISIINVVDPR